MSKHGAWEMEWNGAWDGPLIYRLVGRIFGHTQISAQHSTGMGRSEQGIRGIGMEWEDIL